MKLEGVDDFGGHMLARLSGAPRFNAWMADRIRPFCGEHVLEIGAGIGNVTRVLLPGRRYIATDINPRYLDVLAGQGHGRPSFGVQYCDVTDPASFPAVDGGFDTVVCLNVLEHVEDDLRALGNIRRAHRAEEDRIEPLQLFEPAWRDVVAGFAIALRAPVEYGGVDAKSFLRGERLQDFQPGGDDLAADAVAGNGGDPVGVHGLDED